MRPDTRMGATRGDLLRLFEGGSAAGLSDGELLGRFVARRDEAAFGALVERLGPMVLGACRRILADPDDAEDAFQATFLVLVRKAGSIRERELVATWLYGVAVRVARRARLDAARRPGREIRAAVAEAREGPDPGLEWSEVRAGIDEEIGRLPESHRRLVLLCDVEGLSREEAAARLGWTANMVRGRLERARARLRGRLERRGLSPAAARPIPAVLPATPGPALVAATTRAAISIATGRIPAAALASSASAVALSEGVIRMMMLSRWKLGAMVLISAGAMVAGPAMLAARQGPGGGPPPASPKAGAPADLGPRAAPGPAAPGGLPAAATAPADPPAPAPSGAADPFRPRSAAELGRARVEAARARYEAQEAFYREGRITTDRVVNASRALMDAERDAAGSKAGRVAAARAHHARMGEMLRKEMAELEAGRATQADITEINSGLLEAEFALAREIEAPEPKAADPGPGADLEAKRETRRSAAVAASTPTPPGSLPSPRPAGGPAAAPSPRSLAAAVADFNARASGLPQGAAEPPLTEDEVVAAIRYWQPDRETTAFAKGARTNVTPPGAPIAAFKAIAETRRMPAGARFEVATSRDVGDDWLYSGWWASLVMAREADPGVVVASPAPWHAFPIRERLTRLVPLEEVLEQEKAGRRAHGGLILPESLPLPERIRNLEDRIRWRDRGRAR